MTKFLYTFVIHANAEHQWSKNVRQLLKAALSVRTELVATEKEFNDIRELCFHDGFEFMEIERIPYTTPEKVI